jgi:N-acetylmuramoyl-L-alanine amidase-like protein/zinc carboxypeptidase
VSRAAGATIAAVAAAAWLAAGALAGAAGQRPARAAATPTSVETIGHSVRGRPIHAIRVGDPQAKRKLLIVGVIHGNERAGLAVTKRLRTATPPRGTELWLVDAFNPDGAVARTRQNAHGVDLNRNFPVDWRGGGKPFDTYYPGPRPLSEPESQAIAALVRRIKPRVTIWYHQHLRLVTKRTGGDPKLERLYARRSRLPHRRLAPLPGTITSWQATTFPGDTAFVVELPAGNLSSRATRRHTGAVLAVARAVAPARVRQRPIPFGDRRKRETAAYAHRHYGLDGWRLRNPRVIVEHYTVTDSFQATYNTFAPDVPDGELHELPNVCAHFVIDRDGSIYQIVSTKIICRHVVGLNWTAIGIEHVGRSDAEVLGNRRQLRSSLRLTRSLQGRFRIRTRDVIGHNESLSSSYYRERVARLRGQTHADFRRASMRRYRRLLRRMPAPQSVR